jgi:hypothetical protein
MSHEELHQQIIGVGTAVFERIQELSDTSGSAMEYYEIAETVKKIRRIQVEQLKYPDFGVEFETRKFNLPMT